MNTQKISSEELSKFSADGYCVINDVISLQNAEQIMENVEYLAYQLCENLELKKTEPTYYLTLVKHDRKAAGNIFDTINKLPALNRLFYDERFENIAKQILDTSRVLSPPSQMNLRSDHPVESNHLYPWHTDFAYNAGSENSLVFWIPLTDVDEEIGSLHVLEKSHLENCEYKIDRTALEAKQSAKYFHISNINAVRKNCRETRVNLNFGQGVIFHSKLVHKSGLNKSGVTRFAMQLRWFDACSRDAIQRHYAGGIDQGIYPGAYLPVSM